MGCDLSIPPKQYDEGPIPSHIVHIISAKEMAEIAKPFTDVLGRKITFCAFTNPYSNPMAIYVIDEFVSGEIMRHEFGHLRGWRHPKLLVHPINKNS